MNSRILIVALSATALLAFSSCKKCKTCTAASTAEYEFTSTSGLTEDEFYDLYPTITSNTDLGELCGDDLKQVDGKTLTQTTSQSFFGDSFTITTTTVYDCQ